MRMINVRTGSENDFTKSIVNSISGPIYFELNGNYFPEKNWIDKPFVVLSWWWQALDEIEKKSGGEKNFDFMSGPFDVSVQSDDGTKLILNFKTYDSSESHMQFSSQVNLNDLKNSIYESAIKLVKIAEGLDWNTIEIDGLKTRIIRNNIRLISNN